LVVTGSYFSGTTNNYKQTKEVKATDADYDIKAVINYDGSSFTPDNVEIDISSVKLIETPTSKWLKIINKSNSVLKVYSNPHPKHTDDPDLNMGVISPGEFKITKITKRGTWGYHNHLNPSQGGTVRVN